MNRFIIQVNRGNEWRNVTTINFDADRTHPVVRGNNVVHSRKTAMKEAVSGLAAWSGYFLEPLRLVEARGYSSVELTVISGGRG
jgi:hypothetical protein